jgi:ribosomal protein S27AE
MKMVESMENRKIKFCPNCGKPVEAKDYPTRQTIRITCGKCNYNGFHLEMNFADYSKLDFSDWKWIKLQKPKSISDHSILAKIFFFILLWILSLIIYSTINPIAAIALVIIVATWFWKSS